MVLSIHTYGDKVLRELNKIVKLNRQKEIKELYTNMFDTLLAYGGYGLSAPQVGHNLNLFVIKTQNFQEIFINPEIKLEGLSIQVKEGCLSFPDLEFPVNRRERVQIKFYDRNWTYRLVEYKDLLSIVVQHEYDHLKGRLIID